MKLNNLIAAGLFCVYLFILSCNSDKNSANTGITGIDTTKTDSLRFYLPPEIKVNNNWTYHSIYKLHGIESPTDFIIINIDSIDSVNRKIFWYTTTTFNISDSSHDTIKKWIHIDSVSINAPPTSGFFSFLSIDSADTSSKYSKDTLIINDSVFNVISYGWPRDYYLKNIGILLEVGQGGIGSSIITKLIQFEDSNHLMHLYYKD